MFVDRVRELAFLNSLLQRTQPTAAHMVLLYGRRRVGKTVLARHWAESTDLPTVYWAAEREPANLQRRKLFAKMIGMSLTQTPVFEAWADLWEAFANLIGDQRRILVIDEVTYAAESDEAFLSALQHAWDQRLKQSKLILILSGSHVHTMETLLARGSPLFGRFTGQWHLEPLSFGALREFLPKWSIDERIAAYAMMGGVPAYLERLIPEHSLVDNIREVILDPGGMFVTEPELLLYDEVRDPRVYQAILQAIGAGAHTLDNIANATLDQQDAPLVLSGAAARDSLCRTSFAGYRPAAEDSPESHGTLPSHRSILAVLFPICRSPALGSGVSAGQHLEPNQGATARLCRCDGL